MPPFARRLSATLAAAALVLFAGPLARADQLYADGDGIAPVGNNDKALGTICVNVPQTFDVPIAARRVGGSGQKTFKNDTLLPVVVSGTTGGLTATVNADGIQLPANWESLGSPPVMSADTVIAHVTLPAQTAVGAGSGTVVFSATGTATDNLPYTVSDTLIVTWTAALCDTTPPVISYVVNPSTPNGNAGWYTGDVTLTWTVTDPESAVTKVGCANQTITADQPATTYTCSATSAAPGTAGPVSVTIKRDATAPTVAWTGGPADGGSYVYGAVPGAPTCSAVDALSGPGSCTVSGYSASAGTHTMTASATDVAGNLATASRTYTVTKASSTVTVSCPVSVTYTGSALEPCTAAVAGAGGLNQSVPVTYSGNTNAGTATASATYAGDANHESSANSATFEIAKATSTVTVSCPAGPFVYDGSAQTPCSATVTGVGGLNQTLPVTYANNTSAGTATASASFPGDGNHESSSDSTTFTIGKASSTVTVTCLAGPFVYSGAAYEPCSATVTGAGGFTQSLGVSYLDNINAGTATASATFDGDGNHTGSSDSTTFEIAKAPSSVSVTCTDATYTGAPLEMCTATVSGVGTGVTQAVTWVYSNNINAGAAHATATYAGDANHHGSSGEGTFSIAKASSSVSLLCPVSITYTGSALEPCTATATGAGDLNESLTVSYTDNINAGTAHATATYAGDDNHLGSDGTSSFTIDKAPSTVTVTCTGAPFVYTGAASTPCAASATGAGDLNEPLTVTYSDNINAGTATASATYAGDANHTGNTGSTTFTIDKAPSTVTVACPTSVVFTGSPITPCTAVATGAGGLSVPLTVTYATNTAVGTATASATYGGDGNHLGSTGSATFQIAAWTLYGFYQPVDMNGVWNVVKNGSTVPLKFEVYAGATELTDVSVVKSFTVKSVSCPGATAIADDIELTTTGGTQLRYDSTGGQFIQNWQTPKKPGTCWIVTMTTVDGSSLSANFKLK